MGSSSGRAIRSSKAPTFSRLTVIGEPLPELLSGAGECVLLAPPDDPLERVIGEDEVLGADGLAVGLVRADEAVDFSPVR